MKYVNFLFVLIWILAVKADAQIAVIANKSISVSKLTASSLEDIYSLNTTKWPGGMKIIVYDSKVQSMQRKFFEYIGVDRMNLRKRWLQVQLSGEGKAPEAIDDDDEMVKKVVSTSGAIGYVKSSAVKGDDVRVIATIE